MSYRLRPLARRPRTRVRGRLVVVATVVVLVVAGVVGLRAWARSVETEPLAPISLVRVRDGLGAAAKVAVSPDGNTIATSWVQTVAVQSSGDVGTPRQFRGTYSGTVVDLAFIEDGRVLVVSTLGAHGLFDVATGALITSSGSSLADGTPYIYDVYVGTWNDPARWVWAYPGGVEIVEWQDRTAEPPTVLNKGRIDARLAGPAAFPRDVVVSADGSRVAQVTAAGGVLLFDAATRNFAGELPAPLRLSSADLSADGRMLATCAGGDHSRTIVWDVARRIEVATLVGDAYSCYAAVFHPGGRLVAVGGYHHLTLWDSFTGSVLAEAAPPGSISSLAFDLTGRRLVTAGEVLSQWELSS